MGHKQWAEPECPTVLSVCLAWDVWVWLGSYPARVSGRSGQPRNKAEGSTGLIQDFPVPLHPESPLEHCSIVASTVGLGFSLTEKTQRLRERIQSAKCFPYKPGELSLSSRTCGKERKTTKKPETSVWLWTLIIPVVWICR